MALTVRRLAPNDDRTQFASGDIELDRFFARFAGQNQFRHHVGTTYVAIDEAGVIVGFATVAASEVSAPHLPAAKRKRFPAYPLPVLRLARLAVDRKAQGLGIGSALLGFVFSMVHKMAEDMGCIGLIVDAKPNAMGFYSKLGFIPLEMIAGQLGDRPQPQPMFLELSAIPR